MNQKKIAKKLNLSQMTVSRVLNNSPCVSLKNRERVLKEIRESEYSLDRSAKNLVTGKKGTIGLLVPTICAMQSIYFQPALEGIVDELNLFDKELIFIRLKSEKLFEEDIAPFLHQVDGFILFNMGLNPEDAEKLFDYLNDNIKNYISIQSYTSQKKVPYVSIDNFTGGYDATKYLLSLGHKQIACVCKKESSVQYSGFEQYEYKKRLEGFLLALEEADLQVKDELMFEVQNSELNEVVGNILTLNNKNRPTAIFSFNDKFARILAYKLLTKGVNIPQDISIIGFNDNMSYSEMEHPYLSTIRQPFHELGACAVRQIINARHKRKSEILIKPQLILRESCAKIKEKR